METALAKHLRADQRAIKAYQYAVMMVHELRRAGFIADACYRDAEHHLTELFHREGVEMTTETQRHAEAVLGQLGQTEK